MPVGATVGATEEGTVGDAVVVVVVVDVVVGAACGGVDVHATRPAPRTAATSTGRIAFICLPPRFPGNPNNRPDWTVRLRLLPLCRPHRPLTEQGMLDPDHRLRDRA
nr:hypothetical protein GCM10017745_72380 [Saccharothrix mutabilis subsp. capreolus]